MNRSPTVTMLLGLTALFGAIVACRGSSSSAPTNRLLESLLNAPSEKEFNERFYLHGSVRPEELPAIFEATTSSWAYRRRNGASLLCTTLKGNAAELQQRVILETKYVELWAIEFDCAMDRNPELAGKRPDMIKAALDNSDPRILAVGLRAAIMSNYPGAHEQARKYIDHENPKVRAAAVSGLTPDDVRELLPKLKEMIAKEQDEDTFIMLAKSLIRTNEASATDIVVKQLEQLKGKRDTLWLHFFNDLALFTPPDAMITKLLFMMARGHGTLRDDAFSVFSRWVWSKHLDPNPEAVKMCMAEIEGGNLSTDPRRQPFASEEQEDCENMFSYMHNGKNPINDFEGRIRGKDAVEFAQKWLKENAAK
jgi:hypothetical protein